ncbi:MAG: asparagine synthase (glutamine-hydrolyzing) [Oscillospiraceae bacterium]|nr:asparagine synthase (glutamine-hydrolyzing) [Oscillospiraceae bacterium]
MCAIAGMIGIPFNGQILDKMRGSMQHRGPDGSGSYMEKNGCLLHTRLAIVDPDGGGQPMSLQWENRSYVITYNGEIYNTEDIRKELILLGHTFFGHSDTEVVLHGYAQWGDEVLDKLNGIFAFGIWDKDEESLFLARDRMGVKPLFYTKYGRGLLFASEIKTLLAYPDIPRELDRDGVAQLLLLGPGRVPGSGVFKGIEELKPGYCARFSKEKLFVWQYWKLKDREHTESFSDTLERVRYLVTDAIQRQMVSDVPFGTFLSGGLDSSLISSVCAETLGKRGEQLATFSVDYLHNDQYFVPGKFQPNSDNSYIDQMQFYLETEHHRTVLSAEELVGAMEAATIARDLPGMADVDSSLLLFCRQIRKERKMALSGECADEIFGGYPWYRDPEVRGYNGFPWAQNTAFRKEFLLPEYAVDAEEFVMDQYNSTISACDILPGTTPLERRMKEMVNLNLTWFMQTLLDRKDRMSMACGLEVRVPFCDYRIAEYLYGVPWEMKDHNGREKGLLRNAMEGYLPQQILWRKKSPYPKTHDPRYQDLVSQQLKGILERKDAPIYGIISKETLMNLLTADFNWPWYGQLMQRPQTICYMLQINFWLEHYRINIL